MAHIIIDRRKNDKGKSTVNRQRYVRRVKEQVRDAVKKTIRDGNIKDITSKDGKKIKIPGKGLKQPTFQQDKGGVTDRVYPGNKEFNQGDRIKRPPEGGGGGGQGASPDGEGEDGFEFHLTREEFLDIFFEDLELPDLVKKEIAKIDEWVSRRAGFAVDGNPSRLNIERSMRQSKTRRLALRSPKKKKLKELEEQLLALEEQQPKNDETEKLIEDLKLQIEAIKRKIKAIPFIDDVDLRYNRWEKVPVPATQAVMFAIMDVSASMGEWEKEMAKRFFMLLYMFLFRNYERVEIVFIRHHTVAKEVDEEEFFYSKETGGTLVSTSLEMMKDIIDERYNPQQWNIFACQASDGDNWGADSLIAQEHLRHLLQYLQYYAYVEIDRRGGKDSDLWPYYSEIDSAHDNFAMQVISDVSEIYPVFRGLFEKKPGNVK
jgi:uncharacterized sporulation protein YeaH/YhbH (DUF444 family)